MGRTPFWVGIHLYNLLTLPDEELFATYPGYSKNELRALRRYYRKRLEQGEIIMPEAPHEPTEPVQGRLVKSWEVAMRGQDGEWDTTTLHSYEHLQEGVDEEKFITQAAPTIIRASKVRQGKRSESLTILAGDAQIGFRGDEPFHDETAMDLFQQAVRDLQPDNVVFTGDMIDLPAMSRFEQRSDWQQTTQAAIDRYHSFLAQTRANAPNARIAVVHGNHEARMDRYIRNDAAGLLGIRRANAERELSVLTLQYLVRYGELEVESVDGYPNGCLWLEDNLKVHHGTHSQKGGSNAAKYLRSEDESSIYGHSHRVEVAYRTIATRLGSRTIAAASPGCLARTDGAVPGVRYSVNNTGQTVNRSEDWQQGILVVQHTPANHDITAVRMHDNGMRVYGKFYERQT